MGNWKGIAYFHLNLRIDQQDNDTWDFRIFRFDAAWGFGWSCVFMHALGQVIGEMATAPTAPLLTPTRLKFKSTELPAVADEPMAQANGENGYAHDAASDVAEPPAKMARTGELNTPVAADTAAEAD